MKIIGLTGSIGMGKSAVAAMFREAHVPVFDADRAVHALYAGPFAAEIDHAFPGVLDAKGHVDRAKLSAAVIGKPAAIARLEALVHPAVRAEERDFLDHAAAQGAPIAVLEIPLLFETDGEARCDATIVVSAPPEVQAARVLARPGMTTEKFANIRAKQMSDAEKRARADYVIDTGQSLEATRADVLALIESLKAQTITSD